MLGIQNNKESYKQTYDAFHERINSLEETVFKAASSSAGNLSDKVHRVQFGFINVDKNWKVREKLLAGNGVKNPKYLVVISQMNRLFVGNNLSWLTRRAGKPD